LVRAACADAVVFSASDPAYRGLGWAAYAARAAAMIRALAVAPSPLWICFPAGACTVAAAGGVGRSWFSCGSGSWSECRMAAGLGVSVLVFLPSGVVPPGQWGAWSFVGASAGGRWFLLASCAPAPTLF